MPHKQPLAMHTWGESEVEAGCAVLRSGRTTMGDECAKFEGEFAAYIGTRHAVMVNSGSSANLLMIAALIYTGRLKRGDVVAVPAVSWSTTYSPLIQFGLRLALIDVDDSLTINPQYIPDDAAAIFGVNLLGNSCDFDSLPNAPILLEDNCEALGAEYGGKRTGSIGLMGSHSLFFSHHINAMEGGVITTDDDELHRVLVSLRAHGWTRDWPETGNGFNDAFSFAYPGYSVRPTEVQGAIARAQLKKLPDALEIRRQNGKMYKLYICQLMTHGNPSWFGFPLFADNRAELLQRIGWEARPIVAGDIRRHAMMRFADGTLEFGPDGPWKADYVHDCGFFIGNNPVPLGDALAQLAHEVVRDAA